MKKTKILLTGGGTAGHIWPIVSVIEALRQNSEMKYLYVGSNGPEKDIAKENNIPFKSIYVGKMRDYFSIMNFFDIFKIALGLIQSFFLLVSFRPDVLFAKGGYVTFPVIFWAKIFHLPIVIHESDAVMGRANRWAFRSAKIICVGFPLINYQDLPSQKLRFTGTPVRKDFGKKPIISKERPIILFTGGSQGSHALNELLSQILPELTEKYEIYHLCGEKDYYTLKAKNHLQHYELMPFSTDVAKFMLKSDLVVSRSGANTLAEISALEKPAILIPYPYASNNHQSVNAQIYAKAGAAVLTNEENLTSTQLLSIINRLMEDDQARQELGRHAGEFRQPDAAQKIINCLFEVINAK